MIWATSHLLDHMEVSHVDNHPDVTDHTSLKATIDLEMQREGPGIFRCKIGIQNNVLYQSIIKNCIKDEIFKALVPNIKNNLEYALFKTRTSLEEELRTLTEDKNGKLKAASLSLQIGLLMSRGQTDRGYKKPVTNTDIEIAIPLGMKRIPDSINWYSFQKKPESLKKPDNSVETDMARCIRIIRR